MQSGFVRESRIAVLADEENVLAIMQQQNIEQFEARLLKSMSTPMSRCRLEYIRKIDCLQSLSSVDASDGLRWW